MSWLLNTARLARKTCLACSCDTTSASREAPGASAAELTESAELLDAVSSAGALLSPRDATVLSLAVNLGFGPAEIAVALGVTENNAAVILHRARKRLRNALAAGHLGEAPSS